MNREQEVIKVLAGLIADLSTPIVVLREYNSIPEFNSESKKKFRVGVYRLCLNAVFLNLSKFVELWHKYSDIKRNQLSIIDKTINKYIEKIKKLEIVTFRNDYVAHPQKKLTKSVLTDEEVNIFIQKITEGDAENIFSWIYPLDYDKKEKHDSLMGVIVKSRDMLMDIKENQASF